MDLTPGTRSTCRHCRQNVLWTGVTAPTDEQWEVLKQRWGRRLFSRYSAYKADWRHEGASWEDPKILCAAQYQERHSPERITEEIRYYDAETQAAVLADENHPLWIRSNLQAEPVAYCVEQVEYHGDYSTCNRRVTGEEPFPYLCGMHAKPRMKELRTREIEADKRRQRENEAAYNELQRQLLDDELKTLGFPVEVSSSTYRPVERWTVRVEIVDLFRHFGIDLPFKGDVTASLPEFFAGMGLTLPGTTPPEADDQSWLPTWARDAAWQAAADATQDYTVPDPEDTTGDQEEPDEDMVDELEDIEWDE